MSTPRPVTDSIPARQVGYYYPEWIWRDPNLVKNLLLFFDQVALLVPNYMRDRPEQVDPALVAGLEEHELLLILEPEKVVDQAAAELLAEAMTRLITSGTLDELVPDGNFAELSMSRMGFYGDHGLAEMVFEELRARRLAGETADGVSIPLHPLVRSLYLVLLGQLVPNLCSNEEQRLHATTDRPELVGALVELLSSEPMASAGQVVSADATEVGVDLSSVPLDDVLAFREEHGTEFTAYARGLREFVRQVSLQEPAEREQMMAERLDQLKETASELRRKSKKAWAKAASISLGIVGAAWRASQGDPVGALLAAGAASAGVLAAGQNTRSAYSYIIEAGRRFG